MMRHVPPTAVPIGMHDLWRGIKALSNPIGALNEFQQAFSAFHGASHCYLTSSGRAGMYLALRALKQISNRTHVIAPAYTCPTIVQAIQMAGLRVLLCDLSLDTFGLDRSSLEELIDDSILAIIAVHLFGLPEDMHDLLAIGKQMDIFIIEDSAQSMGARLDDRVVGSWGDIGVFSFGRGKVITTGSGGVITTSNKDIAESIDDVISREIGCQSKSGLSSLVFLASYLLATQPFFWWFIVHSPINPANENRNPPQSFSIGRLSTSQMGVGLSMMDKLIEINKLRQRKAELLKQALRDFPGIHFPNQVNNSDPIFLRLPVLVNDKEKREYLYQELHQNGIGVSRMYEYPLAEIFSSQIDQHPDELPAAGYISQHLLTLPTHHMFTDDDINKTVEIFSDGLAA